MDRARRRAVHYTKHGEVLDDSDEMYADTGSDDSEDKDTAASSSARSSKTMLQQSLHSALCSRVLHACLDSAPMLQHSAVRATA
eukprot:3274953-Karenia_brevis.AAC.1